MADKLVKKFAELGRGDSRRESSDSVFTSSLEHSISKKRLSLGLSRISLGTGVQTV